MSIKLTDIRESVAETLIKASTCFRPDQMNAYKQAVEMETEQNSKQILQMILENALTAEKNRLPLCDDTGIPYVLLEIGDAAEVSGNIAGLLKAAAEGIAVGLRRLPGRPMAVKGDEWERISQSEGLYQDSGMLEPCPIRIKAIEGKTVKITVIMLGGGSEIRARTYRVFHHHDTFRVVREVAGWATEMAGMLGCTPCVPAVGIGRTHYEATCLMMDAMTYKTFGQENQFEKLITTSLNNTHIGTLGLGGSITALNSFLKVGPQRASGVRIVSLRLGCCFDPRRSTSVLG